MNKPIWFAALLVVALQAGCDRRPDAGTGSTASAMSNQSASSPMGRASAP